MTSQMEIPINQAADIIVSARKVVVFTGAGVSTESGIPDFRSPGGIWTKYQPILFQDFMSSEEMRRESWRRGKETYHLFADVEPNPAHRAVVELERLGKLDCVITQNIDNLHQKAGSSPDLVIELHGTAMYVLCMECGKRWPRAEIQKWLEEGVEIPYCDECGGIMKSATVSFGQAMPEKETMEAQLRSQRAEVFIVVGSSLVVYPAAHMPMVAKQSGAKLIIINLAETSFDMYADVLIRGKAGDVMQRLVERVKTKVGTKR
ncbi:MAG: NAD-dependent deacylase [Candidatus Abyssobacteria bacterium SURF_17]|uniref:protein acetyllysine N-acetyltransferase n=1 Tax=Candidatus Abyssobacteria bacterium SURF_17 TaxID=2093361 RepID=A0A419ENQ1_9BACT|nr:MAG: NAD-dependent deacylase [Candidatus Abyssubacteria bacterium SURF_17]